MTDYSIRKTVQGNFPEIVSRVKDALKEQGFGVLTEIDVSETLKKKLGVDYSKYVILGACNPHSAYAVLQAEKEIGLLLPCNVIVYEDDGSITVAAIRPSVAMQMIDNNQIPEIATDVEKKLQKVITEM